VASGQARHSGAKDGDAFSRFALINLSDPLELVIDIGSYRHRSSLRLGMIAVRELDVKLVTIVQPPECA